MALDGLAVSLAGCLLEPTAADDIHETSSLAASNSRPSSTSCCCVAAPNKRRSTYTAISQGTPGASDTQNARTSLPSSRAYHQAPARFWSAPSACV